MSAPDELRWVWPWKALAPGEGRPLEEELQREVIPGHALHGMTARALGRCMKSDDVAFAFGDGTFAVVHLTWRGRPEQGPEWPGTDLYSNVEALQTRIDEDHENRAV